jgi:hypothetical protein
LPPGAAHPEGITVDDRGNVYVTNLALDLRRFDDPSQPTLTNGTGDSPWAADVKVHTISRIPAFIPPISGPCTSAGARGRIPEAGE